MNNNRTTYEKSISDLLDVKEESLSRFMLVGFAIIGFFVCVMTYFAFFSGAKSKPQFKGQPQPQASNDTNPSSSYEQGDEKTKSDPPWPAVPKQILSRKDVDKAYKKEMKRRHKKEKLHKKNQKKFEKLQVESKKVNILEFTKQEEE